MKRFATAAFLALSAGAHAADGVVLIDHAKALAGNVTPGDAPGYPVKITKPGSYKLSSNLVLPDINTSGIVSSVGGVSLDLNGFSIIGTNYCPPTMVDGTLTPERVCFLNGSGSGIEFAAPMNKSGSAAYSIGNGKIIGMGSHGISVTNGIIENVDVSFVGKSGIRLDGISGQVRNSNVRFPMAYGIEGAGRNFLIQNNTLFTTANYAMLIGWGIVSGNNLTGAYAAIKCYAPTAYSGNSLLYRIDNGSGVSGAYCQDGGGNLVFQQP